MHKHVLHLITSGTMELAEVAAVLAEGCASIDVLHLREKRRGARELLAWYESLHDQFPALPVYINDRLDAAAACGAPGVQLGYASLPPAAGRRILPSSCRIGASVHSVEEAVEAGAQGADFLIYGHIYGTASKAGTAPRGTAALTKLVAAVDIPVIAIGGIGPERVHDVLASGCAGIAVISSVFGHAQPEEQLRHFRAALDTFPSEPRRAWS